MTACISSICWQLSAGNTSLQKCRSYLGSLTIEGKLALVKKNKKNNIFSLTAHYIYVFYCRLSNLFDLSFMCLLPSECCSIYLKKKCSGRNILAFCFFSKNLLHLLLFPIFGVLEYLVICNISLYTFLWVQWKLRLKLQL